MIVTVQSLTSFATCVVVLFTTGVAVAQETPIPNDGPIDPYEIRSVGEPGVGGRPAGAVVGLRPFTGLAFFEADDRWLGGNGLIDVEVYARSPEPGPCDDGVLLTSDDDFTITVDSFPYPQYTDMLDEEDFPGPYFFDFPRSPNGKLMAAEFVISDFMAPKNNKKIYFPNSGDKDGVIRICVKMSIKEDYSAPDSDAVERLEVSSVETAFELTVDLEGSFAKFTQEKVNIYDNELQQFEDEASYKVDIDVYLCSDGTGGSFGDTDFNEPVDPTFGPGQTFRFCVAPVTVGYIVDSIKTVRCKNADQVRYLVKKSQPDTITSIDAEPDADGVLGVQSPVTSGYSSNGLTAFRCNGEVGLSKVEVGDGTTRRRVTQKITKSFRAVHKQEDEEQIRKLNNNLFSGIGGPDDFENENYRPGEYDMEVYPLEQPSQGVPLGAFTEMEVKIVSDEDSAAASRLESYYTSSALLSVVSAIGFTFASFLM
jgi:hypothetical protein